MLLRSLLVLAVLLPPASYAKAKAPLTARVSVVLSVDDQRFASAAVEGMQDEAASILVGSGVDLRWHLYGSHGGDHEGELIVFRMRGKCAMDPLPLVADEMGLPLARTHTSDGEILSFGEVDCDRVRNSIKRSLLPADFARGNEVLGKALGRVLAHEIYHILTRSASHADEGIAQRRLSARELTAERLAFSQATLKAIRDQMALVKRTKSASPAPAFHLP